MARVSCCLGGAIVALSVLVMSWPASGAQSGRAITVAAASDLQTVLPELIARFEKASGVTVTRSFASSGTLAAQIQNGAPFDVFFSADLDYARQLVTSGLADSDSLYEYAVGRLVLWTRKATGINVGRGLAVLGDERVRRIAIANPQFAPYGRAAVAAMQHQGLYDTVRAKLVFGENISQAAQLVESGNADVGVLAESLALGPALQKSGSYADIPASFHPPIRQAAVVVRASRSKEAARALLAFMKRPDSLAFLARFGFSPPSGTP